MKGVGLCGVARVLAAVALCAVAATSRSATLEAVEYYNAQLDHYFVTASSDEITKLDAGTISGWARTGQHFTVDDPAVPIAGTSPVCRFYGVPAAGLDSHFYSASPAECASVAQRFPGIWEMETSNAFGVGLPDPVSGQCPAASIPVYRAWNNRVDSNHRFTTDPATLQAMVARGYIAEGYGPPPMPVAMCSPTTGSPPPAGSVPSCVVSASNPAPYIGSSVLLTAACSNAPSAFRWTGCISSTSTCMATSATAGQVFYTVVASNSTGTGAPASVDLIWQSLPPPPKCAIASTTQTDPPVVHGLAVLRASCDSNPTSFSWSGCASTTDVCLAHESSTGLHGYSVIARNAGGSSAPVGMSLNWVASAPPPPGFCGQFPSYLLSDIGSDTVRVETASFTSSPGFAWNGAWTVRFVVPPGAFRSSIGRISGAEYVGQRTMRDATISTSACDFRAVDPAGANGPIARIAGFTTTFLVSFDPSQTTYPVLQPGGTYYYNVRNVDASGSITCPSDVGRCDAFVDVIIQH